MKRFLSLLLIWLIAATSIADATPRKRVLLSGTPGWVLRGGGVAAAVDCYFQTGQFFGPCALTSTRNSVEYVADSAGNWTAVPALKAAIGTGLGLASWEARTNAIRNNSGAGAVVNAPGTCVGNSGTMPTNWASNGTSLFTQVVGQGTENGIDYVDLRICGTTGVGQHGNIYFDIGSIAVTYGQTVTLSAFMKMIAGTMTNITSIAYRIDEITGSPFAAGGPNINPTGASLGSQRSIFSYTVQGQVTTFLNVSYIFFLNNTAAVDVTLRIGWPQNEINPLAVSNVASATANGVVSAVQTSGGSGCSNGQQFFNGTTGTGTKATYAGNVSAGSLVAGALQVNTTGSYSVNPGVDTLTGGGCSVAPTITPVMGGGTGYGNALTGTLTWAGAGCPINPVINVTTNAGGAVVTVNSVTNPGSCNTFPPSIATTWTPGGGLSAGSGAALNLTPTNNAAVGFATPPIRTTGTAGARLADATFISPFPNFGPAASAITVYWQGSLQYSIQPLIYAFPTLFTVSRADTVGIIGTYNRYPAGSIFCGGSAGLFNAATGVAFKSVCGSDLVSSRGSVNGGAVGTGVPFAAAQVVGQVGIANGVGQGVSNSITKRAAIWPTTLTPDPTLRSLSNCPC